MKEGKILIEEKIEITQGHLIDISSILYQFKNVFDRMKVIRTLFLNVELLLYDKRIELDQSLKEAMFYYLHFINNEEYQLDFHLFCQLPCRKVVKNNPWRIMVELKIYRDRIIDILLRFYPDFKEYLEVTKVLFDEVITELENRITILLPGEIQVIHEEDFLTKDVILERYKNKKMLKFN